MVEPGDLGYQTGTNFTERSEDPANDNLLFLPILYRNESDKTSRNKAFCF
jgi:hypothetical protein